MKKPYVTPEIEKITYCLADSLNRDVIHDSQFEQFGQKKNWSFELEDDDEELLFY